MCVCVCLCVRSATNSSSREHMASVCAVSRKAASVRNTADFLSANSFLCQVLMMKIDILCAVMEL